MASSLVGARHPRSHALTLAAARRDPVLGVGFNPDSVRHHPVLHENLVSMDETVSAALQRSGQTRKHGDIVPELQPQLGELQEKVDSLLLPWEHSLVSPRLDPNSAPPDRWITHQALPVAMAPPRDRGVGGVAAVRSPSAPTLGSWRVQNPMAAPPKSSKIRGQKPPPRIMAWPEGGRIGGYDLSTDTKHVLQRTLEGMESTEVSKGVLMERVLESVEAGSLDARDGLGALESGLLERLLPKGAAAVRMGLEDMIDKMLERPSPQKTSPRAPAPVDPRGEPGCNKCSILSKQVAALGQALTGFCSLAYHWSAGLPPMRRRGIAELALEYAGPCAHIYADLAQVCVELEQARWGDGPHDPKKKPDTINLKNVVKLKRIAGDTSAKRTRKYVDLLRRNKNVKPREDETPKEEWESYEEWEYEDDDDDELQEDPRLQALRAEVRENVRDKLLSDQKHQKLEDRDSESEGAHGSSDEDVWREVKPKPRARPKQLVKKWRQINQAPVRTEDGVETSAVKLSQFTVEADSAVDSLGFVPLLPPGIVVVEQVYGGSWAQRVGILPSDEIYTANERPTHEMQQDDFVNMLESRPLRLVLIRKELRIPAEETGKPADGARTPRSLVDADANQSTPPRPQRSIDYWDDEPASPRIRTPEAQSPRLVGNYDAGRNDGSVAYVVDNTKLRAKSAGLGYRRSPNLQDRDGKSFAKWGTVVHGYHAGSGWVNVEGRYLPKVVDGIEVLVPKTNTQAGAMSRAATRYDQNDSVRSKTSQRYEQSDDLGGAGRPSAISRTTQRHEQADDFDDTGRPSVLQGWS